MEKVDWIQQCLNILSQAPGFDVYCFARPRGAEVVVATYIYALLWSDPFDGIF